MSEKNHSSIGIQGLHAHEGAHGIRRLKLFGGMQRVVLLVFIVLGVSAAVIVGQRLARAHALAEAVSEQSTRYVSVIAPRHAAADAVLQLPGTLQGMTEAPIYARTSGYLAHWYKDIGDHVKQGDLLAQIDTPEVTQQLNEAQANLQLAQATFERWDTLRRRDAVSQQEFEEKKNALATATATVKRLQEQVGFSRIVAPFSGTVTQRNVDVGSLIDAGGTSRLLFTLVKNDPLRVYIYVPQNYAQQVKAGNPAEITLQEMPGKTFEGRIARSAGAIDTTTRTLQVEVDLPNSDGKLLPGAYVQVGIKARGGNAGALVVPGNTLLFRPEGVRAAVVDENGKVHLKPVVIGRELGVDVELGSGIEANDRLILNPPDSLNDGDSVTVVAKDEKGKAQPGKGSAS